MLALCAERRGSSVDNDGAAVAIDVMNSSRERLCPNVDMDDDKRRFARHLSIPLGCAQRYHFIGACYNGGLCGSTGASTGPLSVKVRQESGMV